MRETRSISYHPAAPLHDIHTCHASPKTNWPPSWTKWLHGEHANKDWLRLTLIFAFYNYLSLFTAGLDQIAWWLHDDCMRSEGATDSTISIPRGSASTDLQTPDNEGAFSMTSNDTGRFTNVSFRYIKELLFIRFWAKTQQLPLTVTIMKISLSRVDSE